jgi:hypothetical protein
MTTHKSPTDEDLQHEVELTREELSRTVERLAHKLDVKAHARRRGDEVMTFVREHRGLLAGGLTFVLLLVFWLRHD